MVLVYIMLVESLSFKEIAKIEVGAEYKSGLDCDTLLYHTYYQNRMLDTFPYLSPYWTFVRFTPNPGDTSPQCSLYRVAGWYIHTPNVVSRYPCTTVVWRGEPSPGNVIYRYIAYERDINWPPVRLEGRLPAPLFRGQDIWMGRTTLADPAGDTMYNATDITISGTPDRNFYSTSGQYGTRVRLSTWQNLDLAFEIHICCRRPAGAEKNDYEASYFNAYPNIFSGNKISFSYKISKQAILNIYGLDGSLIASKLLPPGENRIMWRISLTRGIYFYKLHTAEKIFYDKFVIL